MVLARCPPATPVDEGGGADDFEVDVEVNVLSM
jgi:hypothetical protein